MQKQPIFENKSSDLSDDEAITVEKVSVIPPSPSISSDPIPQGGQEGSDENSRTVMEEMPQPETCCPPQCNYITSQTINVFSAILGLGLLLYYGTDLLITHLDRGLSNSLGIVAGGLHLFLGSTNTYYTEQIRRNQILTPVRMERNDHKNENRIEIRISDNRSALHNNQNPKRNDDSLTSFSNVSRG
jgi:hypothetical protein